MNTKLSNFVFLSVACAGFAAAQPFARPPLLRNVGFDQRLNTQLPLKARFIDENSQRVTIGDYFHGKPVVLALVYYQCPSLCNVELNGVLRALKKLSLNVGEDFEVVTVSFDPRETTKLAATKKASYIQQYGRPGAERGWHFLVGPEESSKAVADAVGFRYAFDPSTSQYAHASGIVVLTPEGRVSRYLFGVEYPPQDLRLALVESSNNKIGSPVDQILLFCYHYDPTRGKYGLFIINLLRVLGIATVLILFTSIIVMVRRDRHSVRHA